MFNLEQSIAEWRQRMLAAGVKNPGVLDELESHLREDVARQRQSGAGVEQAFALAVQRFGPPAALQREFTKTAANNGARLQKLKSAFWRFIGVPTPSQNLFSPDAREILELGEKEALGFHHDFIGTEHLLLGLLESETDMVRGVLKKIGVDAKIIRQEIEKIVGSGPYSDPVASPPLTPRAQRALKIAGSEARALRQSHVGVEHIFLGLLLEGSGVAAIVLKALGVNIQTARQEILQELGRNQARD